MNTTPSKENASVYLIDASIYIFRGWFVLPDSIRDSDGQALNAVYGFADSMLGFWLRVISAVCGFSNSAVRNI